MNMLSRCTFNKIYGLLTTDSYSQINRKALINRQRDFFNRKIQISQKTTNNDSKESVRPKTSSRRSSSIEYDGGSENPMFIENVDQRVFHQSINFLKRNQNDSVMKVRNIKQKRFMSPVVNKSKANDFITLPKLNFETPQKC